MSQRVERQSTAAEFIANSFATDEVIPFRLVSRYLTDGAPRPVVAQVDVYNILSQSSTEYLATPARTVELPAGFQPATVAIGDTGQLRFTYGAQAAKRVIITDLKSGSYQLPPSNEVTVEATVAGPPDSQFTSSLAVRASCDEGWQAAPARAVFSYAGNIDGNSQWSAKPFPDGARWVTVLTAAVPGSLTAPTLRFQPNVTGGPIVYLDMLGEVYYPSVLPTELSVGRYNSSSWLLYNDSANVASATVRFYLEF